MEGDKLGDQLPLPKVAIWVFVSLIIVVVIWQVYEGYRFGRIGLPLGFEIEFSDPPDKEILAHENLLASNYHYMYLNEINLFGANIALDDSVDEALASLPTGNVIIDGKIKPTYGDSTNASIVRTKQPMLVGTIVDLTGPEYFEIKPADYLTSGPQDIPQGNPGQNIAKWKWNVIPHEKKPGTLHIAAYRVKGDHRTLINSTEREIDVVVISTPTNASAAEAKPAAEAAAKAAVEEKAAEAHEATRAAAEKAEWAKKIEATTKNVEETAKKADETAKKAESATQNSMPGFESIFAIAGLLAAAYLVMGRKK
jgi:hypothetical protein